MELIKCVNAYTALLGLKGQACDYSTANAILTLKRRLEPQAAFFLREEQKLMEQYAATDEDGEILLAGEGRVQLRDEAAAAEYRQRRNELAMTEVQEEFPKLHARPPEKITAEQLEALEEFLEFGE